MVAAARGGGGRAQRRGAALRPEAWWLALPSQGATPKEAMVHAPHPARSERACLCDVLTEFGEDAPTLCEGWLTRDLAAHLFVRERRPLAMPGILLGGPFAKLTAGSMAFAFVAPWLCGPRGQGAIRASSVVAAARRSRQYRRALRAHRRRAPSGTRLRAEKRPATRRSPLGRSRSDVPGTDPQGPRCRARARAARRRADRRSPGGTRCGAQRWCPGDRVVPLRAETGRKSLAGRP